MIRPLTFLSLIAAAGAGLHLYGVKHEVSQLEKALRETVRQTEAARERTAVLRAEWALLNEPERLRAAARSLPLETMQTTQFIRPADLDRRLPAAVAFAGAQSLFAPPPGEAPTMVAEAPEASQPQQTAAAESPAASRTAPPVQVIAQATPRPAPAPAAQPAAERAPAPRTPPAQQPKLAGLATPRTPEPAARPAEAVRAAPRVLANRAPAAPTVDRDMNFASRVQPPAPTPLLRTAMHTAPAPAPRAAEPPAPTGSFLGGAARPLLAPPVPIASAAAATLDARVR